MNEILTSLRRTPYQTFAALSVLFLTLLLSGLLFLSVTFIQGLLHFVETRPQVIVYFQLKATSEQIQATQKLIQDSQKAKKITYVSQEDAYKEYAEFTKKDNPLLLEMTSEKNLPSSLEIDALKPEYYPELADLVKNQPGVDEVQFQKDIVDNLLSLTAKIRISTAIFFGYLMFMSIIVLTTTLSFKIALKRDEISILKLLGATNAYIRRPFVAESVFLGILATALANIVIIGALISMNAFLQKYLAGIPELTTSWYGVSLQVWPFSLSFAIVTLAVTAIFSLMITLISSYTATNRYL